VAAMPKAARRVTKVDIRYPSIDYRCIYFRVP
jgi:hypothetical protein